MHDRFARHTLKLLIRHRIDVVGVWVDAEDRGSLTYLVRFASKEHRDKAWSALAEDSDWQTVKQHTDADGPIVERISSRLLRQAPYWDGIAPARS